MKVTAATNILVAGATSAIALHACRVFAAAGARFHLLGRDTEKLSVIAADLSVRGSSEVSTAQFDAAEPTRWDEVIDAAERHIGAIDLAIIAYGTLPDEDACRAELSGLHQALTVNGVSTVMLMAAISARFEKMKRGQIVVISSVAGDRGRSSNYIYGSAKAMVSQFASGLAQRLAPLGIHVLVVKPGFVDTPMTAKFPKGVLWSSPDKVAREICLAITRERAVIYTPGFWRIIMRVVREIPESIFRRIRF
jgi:short-subunit dehydrogenase